MKKCLIRKTKEREEDENFYIFDFLEEHLKDTKYEFFEVGEGDYTGEENELFVVLDEFKIDFIKEDLWKLREFLLKLDLIDKDDVPDLVGGLRVH